MNKPSIFKDLPPDQQELIRSTIAKHPFYASRSLNHFFFVRHLAASYEYFSELMATNPVSKPEFQVFKNLQQHHKSRASIFGTGLCTSVTLAFVKFVLGSHRSYTSKLLMGFVALNFADAIYDSGMYLQFFTYAPYYMNSLLELDDKQSIAPHLTSCFIEQRIQHQAMVDTNHILPTPTQNLIILKVWRNIGRKRLARWGIK